MYPSLDSKEKLLIMDNIVEVSAVCPWAICVGMAVKRAAQTNRAVARSFIYGRCNAGIMGVLKFCG
jgi:hypothetical protein